MKRKMMARIMVFLLTICCSFNSTVLSTEAAAKKSGNKKWKKAYLEIVNEMNKDDKARKTSSWFYSPYKYDLIYFDGDSIPELVVGYTGYWVSMYSYEKSTGTVRTVIDKWGYGAMGNVGYSYLPKKNCLENSNSDYAGAIRYQWYGKMKNYEIVDMYPKSLKECAFRDKNKNGYPDDGEYTSKSTYYYGNKKISKKKFDSFGKSGKYKFLDGTMSYKKMKNKLK